MTKDSHKPGRYTAVVLWAQRQPWPLPKALRSAARRLVVRLRRRGAIGFDAVDDWTRPLVGAAFAVACPVPDREGGDGQHAPVAGQPAAPPARHCLLVTSMLEGGGMEEVVAFLAQGLPNHGFATSVLRVSADDERAPSAESDIADRLRAAGIDVSAVGRADVGPWLQSQPLDVICAHATPHWVLDCAVAAAIPFVETLHGPDHLMVGWTGTAARTPGTATLVAVSEQTRQQYLLHDPAFPPEDIVTIPNVVNDTRLPAVDRAAARAWLGVDDQFLFLCLARHALQKNTYGLITAFDALASSRSDVRLLVAGRLEDAEYAQQVRMHHGRLQHRERVHLRDGFPHPSILLAAADAFVLDSFFEGWPLSTMEALHAGLPVVMTDVGGAREQMGDDGAYGLVVRNPLGDPDRLEWDAMYGARFVPQVNCDELVAALHGVVDDRDRWAQARPRIADDARRRFRAEPCLVSYAEVLAQAAAKRR